MADPTQVIAEYSQTPLGTWTASIEADVNPASGQVISTQVSAATLKECQEAVLERVQELADTTKSLYSTIHLLDRSPQKFIEAYATHVGFADGWHEFS